MSDELKSCPFCGGVDIEEGDDDRCTEWMGCNKCGAQGPAVGGAWGHHSLSPTVAEQWNRRTPAPLPDNVREAVGQALCREKCKAVDKALRMRESPIADRVTINGQMGIIRGLEIAIEIALTPAPTTGQRKETDAD